MKTVVIEAIYHSNARSELRLNSNRVYMGNLRLGNLGCKTTTNPADRKLLYNTTSGVLGLIENIYLYDGNQLLDQLINAHHLFGFRNVLKSNAFNNNKNQFLTGVTNSYYVEQDPNGTNTRSKRVQQAPIASYNLAASDDSTLSGWLNLTSHFNFLKNMVYNVNGQSQQFIDTNVFRNLRVVIEWRNPSEITSVFQGKTGTTPVKVNISPPLLFCDETIGLSLPQSLAFQYDVFEVDKLVCNSAGGAGVVATKARLNGFNGKFVKKVLFMNIDPAELRKDTNGDGIKCDGSQVFNNEVLQLSVNGENLLDFNGIDSDARRLSLCADAWGDLTLPLGAYSNMSQDLAPLLTQQVLDLKGRMSYSGCMINTQVSDFTVTHQREVSGAVPSFLMYIWGEIPKQVQVTNGSYLVGYA